MSWFAFLATCLSCAALVWAATARYRRKLTRRVRSLEAQVGWYHDALRIAGAGTWQWKLDEDEWKWIEDVFHATGSTLRYRVEMGDAFLRRVHPDDIEKLKANEQACRDGAEYLHDDYRYRLDTGEVRWLRDIGHLVEDGSGARTMVGITLDITDEKTAALIAEKQRRTDELTGLSNRGALLDWLEAKLQAPTPITLAFVDLNGFKPLNDRHGHAAGDRCLQAIGDTLLHDIHQEIELAARIGGDEFVVAVPHGPGSRERVEHLVRRALNAANSAFPAGSVGAATGIADSTRTGPEPTLLLEVADAAMYAAKASGARIAFHMDGEAPSRIALSA